MSTRTSSLSIQIGRAPCREREEFRRVLFRSAEVDLLVRIDGLADRKLVGRDDALGLVADVDEDLVLVDPDDVAGDDPALLYGPEGGVVVGDDLAVYFEQKAIRPVDDPCPGILHQCLPRPKRSAAVSLPGTCLFERRS